MIGNQIRLMLLHCTAMPDPSLQELAWTNLSAR